MIDQKPKPAPLIQRSCACGGACDSCRKKKPPMQRHALGPAPSEAPAIATDVLQTAGRPLDAETRSRFESRFARSFADVRVHTDREAAEAASSIHAAAYTAGSHIVFGAGRYEPGTDRGKRLLAHELTHVVQQHSGAARGEGVGPAGDAFEQEADRVAEAVATDAPVRVQQRGDGKIRRQLEDEREPEPAAAARRLIVEDSEDAGPGQMRRQQFLDELHTAICATADAEMARLGRSTAGCPALARWREFARRRNAAQLETSVRRYAAEADRVRTARDYVPIVARRVAQSIAEWGRSGRITGVPPELAELGIGGRFTIGVGSLVSGLFGGFRFKTRDGEAPSSSFCPFVQLGGGRPLESGIASRMERAFGRSFGGVRIHTEPEAASATARANARAFTVGRDIAFAAGEYQPGTPIGDALLAHELAHVAQQDGAADGMLMKSDGAASEPLEQDADDAAVHAVVSLWGKTTRFARQLGRTAAPRLKSDLRLQRCKNTIQPVPRAAMAQAASTACNASQRTAATGLGNPPSTCCTQPMLTSIQTLHGHAIARVARAVTALGPPLRGNAAAKLRQHFHLQPNDPRVYSIVLPYYRRMRARMEASTVTFVCRNGGECGTRGAPAFTNECGPNTAAQRVIALCGNYDNPENFMPVNDQNIGILVHEYTHATCIRDQLVNDPQWRNTERPPGPPDEIVAGPGENYRYANGPDQPESSRYTGMDAETAIHQPDPYKWFAMEVEP